MKSNPTNYYGQFFLSQSPNELFNTWEHDEISSWTLQSCPSLPKYNITDKHSRRIGWILGYPISNQILEPSPVILSTSIQNPDFWDDTEKYLSKIAGRFITIILITNEQRIYLDAAGQLSAVYNIDQQSVGSSLNLLVREESPNKELIDVLDIPNQDNFFPFGLTADNNVFRIIPNHYLNLASFSQNRHWPKKDELTEIDNDNIQETIKNIAYKLKSNIQTLSSQSPLLITLTAGRDARLLLAAAKDELENTEFYTTAIPDPLATLDCRSAKIIASRFNLKHRILEWTKPGEQELNEWQLATGNCVAGRTWQTISTLKQLDPSRVVLEGLCGEVGRSTYWEKEDFLRGSDINGKGLLRCMGVPLSKQLIDAAEKWLSSLPANNLFDILDILFIEQRLGCWAGPSHYGHIFNIRNIPLSDKQIFSWMMSLPYEYRFKEKLDIDIISLLWPELLEVPFNNEIMDISVKQKTSKNLPRTINIASLPARGAPSNPYVDLFYDALEPHGIELAGELIFDIAWLEENSEQLDCIHLHWPEVLWREYTPHTGARPFRSFFRAKIPGAWRIFKITDQLKTISWVRKKLQLIDKIKGYFYFRKFLITAHQAGIRILWTFHNAEIHEGSDYIDRLAYKKLAQTADLVIFHSKIAQNDFLGFYKTEGQTVLMPHGNYDNAYPEPRTRQIILKELGLRDDLPVVSCLGMLRAYKGLDVAIKAIKLLDTEVQFLCAGSPHPNFDLAALQNQFTELSNAVLIPKFLSAQEFADYSAVSDCLLMPYKKITGSGALLAGLSLSRGVVASDLPYFREILADHPTAGLLITEGNAVLFAKSIRTYLSVPASKRNQAAKDLANCYNWNKVVLPVVDIINSFK